MEKKSVRNMLLGEALVAKGLLTSETLKDVLKEHRLANRRMTTLLCEKGLVAQVDIARTLAETQGLPYIDLESRELSPEVASVLSESHARTYLALVLEDRKGTYLVAMSDPRNLSVQDFLSSVLKRPLEIAVVADNQLEAAFDRVYSTSERLTSFAREVESDVEKDQRIFNLNQVSDTLADADAPVIKLLQTIFNEATQFGVSDIHIEPQSDNLVVRYRVDGQLQTRVEVDLKIAPPLVVKLKLMAGLEISEKRLPQDGRITVKTDNSQMDVRMSTLPTQYGESIVLRILGQNQGSKELNSLGMPESILKRFVSAISAPNGIILATGPTGSGKTTTLYGALAHLNTPEVEILTAEDPIEYRLAGINQVQINEKIGLSFPVVLRSFLRQDPDIILVGEIRDAETAEIATRAAMTGHLVLSTLHTNDSVSAPARLVDMGVPSYLVANTLRAVLSQRLLRLVCTRCSEPYKLSDEESDWVCRFFGEVPGTAVFKRGKGCSHCKKTGYRGRTGIYELLELGRPLSRALSNGTPTEFEEAARDFIGLQSLVHQGLRLAFEGRTTVIEAIRHTLVEL